MEIKEQIEQEIDSVITGKKTIRDAAQEILDMFGPEKLTLNRLHYEDGKFDLNLYHPLFAHLLSDIVSTFDDTGGINYVEFSMQHETRGSFTVLIQRDAGLTPAQKNIMLEAENKQLRNQEATR